MKLFVAIPCYDGKIHADTARSLLNEQGMAAAAGFEFQAVFLPGCSLVHMARNQAVTDFLKSDADKMIFVDADVSWEPGSLLRLAAHDREVAGGAYRLKQEVEAYPVGWLDRPELWAEDGLLEVASLPGGFLCIRRDVFERFQVAYPGREYSHYDWSGFAYFDSPFKDGRLWGEDAVFCHYWREMGGKVWLDPELSLTHHGGSQAFPGQIGNWLKSRIQLEAA